MATNTIDNSGNPMDVEIGQGRWLIAMGVALTVLGVLALVLATATTLISVVFIGIFFLIASIFQAVFAFTSGKWSGFGLHLLLAVLYAVAGVFLVGNPIMGAASLTLFLAFFFVVSGVFRMVGSVVMRFNNWGWAFFSGAITTILGLYVLKNMGFATLTLLGIIFAVDFILFGSQLMAMGFGMRRIEKASRSGTMHQAYT